ncbi:MAG: hypothetical protein RsTaC01_0436 [Candidatus Paraimprobicoccus trichonymphae]|uniref:Uncharacterized protein n=1 Tax=Candidatus Paraimprobicoccus trichonymphae TaxID=3033793 RepID=A0AA48KZU6_9FIRM|nr:MAG: hypothetical protein RsTaC01_0436 [Candidatus Paraimprobicoccus trichonymphae]
MFVSNRDNDESFTRLPSIDIAKIWKINHNEGGIHHNEIFYIIGEPTTDGELNCEQILREDIENINSRTLLGTEKVLLFIPDDNKNCKKLQFLNGNNFNQIRENNNFEAVIFENCILNNKEDFEYDFSNFKKLSSIVFTVHNPKRLFLELNTIDSKGNPVSIHNDEEKVYCPNNDFYGKYVNYIKNSRMMGLSSKCKIHILNTMTGESADICEFRTDKT